MIDEKINILTAEYCNLQIPEKRVELDLGCGKGKFTVELAEKFPECHVIAADVMIGRLRKLVKKTVRLRLDNIEILRVEASSLMGYILPDNSVDRLHILCPDPWPKTKHKGNRLISSQFLSSVVRVLKPEGVFHFSSDNNAYFDSVSKVTNLSGLFSEEQPELIADIIDIKTDFQLLWEGQGLTVRHVAWRKK